MNFIVGGIIRCNLLSSYPSMTKTYLFIGTDRAAEDTVYHINLACHAFIKPSPWSYQRAHRLDRPDRQYLWYQVRGAAVRTIVAPNPYIDIFLLDLLRCIAVLSLSLL